MSKNYHDFVNRYSINHIRVNSDRNYSNVDYYNKTASYYNDREEIVEMEIPRHSFENLVECDREFTRLYQDQRDEAYMRRKHPAIADAYDKYRMLLELYR